MALATIGARTGHSDTVGGRRGGRADVWPTAAPTHGGRRWGRGVAAAPPAPAQPGTASRRAAPAQPLRQQPPMRTLLEGVYTWKKSCERTRTDKYNKYNTAGMDRKRVGRISNAEGSTKSAASARNCVFTIPLDE